ncbi:MAG: Lon protease [Bifidobacteriaceae bacterium]|nr:Lon protease [Bifidobacteriaceae bacterium]
MALKPQGPSVSFRAYIGWIAKHAYWGVAVLLVAFIFFPTNYVMEKPGPTMNVLGKAVLDYGEKKVDLGGEAIEEGGTSSPSGSLDVVTVNVVGSPSSTLPVFMAVANYFNPSSRVLPKEVVFPIGSSLSQDEKNQQGLMEEAKRSAKAAAASFLKSEGLSAEKVENAKINSGPIGGPSAGMIFALGLIEKATGQDLTGGKNVAGTGTLAKAGKVGEIGGIASKMIAARRDGASFFLAPASNCAQVLSSKVPEGLRVVPVPSLSGALKALKVISSNRISLLPYCKA